MGINRQAQANDHLDQAYSYYEATEEFEQALLECDTAIEIDPSLADAHNLRGIVLEELGRKAEAVEAYKQALELDPDFSEAKANLARLKEEIALLPYWLRNSIFGVIIFLAITYCLELYVWSKSHRLLFDSTLDRLLAVGLLTLYSPGLTVWLFPGTAGLEPEISKWIIRIISSLAFACIAGTMTMRRKKVWLLLIAIFLPLYLLCYGVWYFFSMFADWNIG